MLAKTKIKEIPEEEYEFFSSSEDEDNPYDYLENDLIELSPSEFTEFAVFIPSGGEYKRFSFEGRRYMRTIYDTPAQRRIIMAGRQVEKCVTVRSLVSSADGSYKQAGAVEVGDLVSCMDAASGAKTTTGKVSWVSERFFKPCIRISTRQGHFIEVAKTHPMRRWGSWLAAGALQVGDRIAVARRCGEFPDDVRLNEAQLGLTAYLLGDGGLTDGVTFTSLPGVKLDEFCSMLAAFGDTWKVYPKTGTDALQVKVHVGVAYRWVEQQGLAGKSSVEKFVPRDYFRLSREATAFFLNRLWSTDGHVKQNTRSKYSLEYCSISERLVSDVQALLWKFGIPSKIRSFVPTLYKDQFDDAGNPKVAYVLRIETQEGVRRFLVEIAALGKSENVPLPSVLENNNRDTYPYEVMGDICKILNSREDDGWHANRRHSLYAFGLRRTLKHPPTKKKLQAYVNFFRMAPDFDQTAVDVLEQHIDTDLYWDEIVGIEKIGDMECVDFEVEGHHNFIVNGFVTHNSTMLGNQTLAYSAMNVGFKTLYVSPSNTQTKVFSRDRIKEPIETSPVLKNFTNTKLLSNVLEKKFVNRSQITLRFAFLNADRCRGIPADYILIDEFQDILLDNIPVIEECASHSEHKLFTYSGTPKSLDNAIEFYHQRFSTQNEWVVPCRKHGVPTDPSSWHWNVLSEENIGPTGLICERCGGDISAADPDCQWAAMNPEPAVEKPFEGFRIPQLMVPWIDWDDILDKQRKYPRPKFFNEVLGRSYDSGTRPLTQQDVRDNCNPKLSMHHHKQVAKKWATSIPIFMGVDWGSGEGTYSVMSLGAYLPFDPNIFTYFYLRRFEGSESEPRKQIEIITHYIDLFNVAHIGVDYGGGHWPNDELVRRYGAEKVHKYQWVGNVKFKVKFEPKLGVPRFLCHRTEVMSDYFNAMKRRNVFRFPRWQEFEDPHGQDFLNIFSEYNDRLRMNVYKHAPGMPDDSFHSCCFGFLSSFYYKKRPDVIAPKRELEQAEDQREKDELDIVF